MLSNKKKCVLFAWEMGGGLGHITRLVPLAECLLEQNIEVVFAAQDLSRIENIITNKNLKYVQAPLWLKVSPTAKSNQSNNYADLLGKLGYLNESGLKALVKAWLTLIELVDPDLLVVDHAPTALLASRATMLPTVQVGNSFTTPPAECPMPPFMWRQSNNFESHLESENKVLNCINTVLSQLNINTLPHLGALFDSNNSLILDFAELDTFPRKNLSKVQYIGPVFESSLGKSPKWPSQGKHKIFAYLYASYWDIENILNSMSNSNYKIIAYISGSHKLIRTRAQTSNVTISSDPINISKIIDHCDAVICHAGAGTVSQSLLAGCPVLLLPRQIEQYMRSLSVVDMGAGICIEPQRQSVDYNHMLDELIKSKKYLKNAKKFAHRYRDFEPNKQLSIVTNLLLEMVTALPAKDGGLPTTQVATTT